MHIVEWAAIPSKLRLDGVMAMGAKFSKHFISTAALLHWV